MERSTVIRAANLCLSAAAALCVASPLLAEGLRVRSEVGTSITTADATSFDTLLGFQNMNNTTGGLRFMWDHAAGPVRFEFHASVGVLHGQALAYAAALAPSLPPTPPATLLNMTSTWMINADTAAIGTIDRASVSYTTDNLVLKVGRQAITWGSGTVFHPSDIVAPFSPSAIDTSYKPGVDMVYAQYLFDNGADLQAIAVPRALVTGGPVSFDASTYALLGSMTLGPLDGRLTLAKDRGDTVAGVGLSGPLGGASWNAEYVHWTLASGATHPSWLFNISNFSSLGGLNIAYFAEYFHNGFGVDASVPFDALPASLTKRMSTGQVFNAGPDFLALGAQVQMSENFSLMPSAVISLNDRSAIASLGASLTLGDNTDLSFSYMQPIGADGTEFGGRETSAGSGVFIGPSKSVSLRLVHFF